MGRAIGDIFAKRFKLQEELGHGGNGEVYEVLDDRMGAVRALKLLVQHQQRDEKARERFVRESRAAAAIASDHVVHVYDYGVDDDGTPWLLMERLHGANLAEHVREHGPLSLDDARRLVVELGHALGAAHAKSIVHLDLKPANLFLATAKRAGAPRELKVLDFGLAHTIQAGRTSVQMTTQMGSLAWMPPEQHDPGTKLHETADVWPLGLIAFWMLTGRAYWRAMANGEDAVNGMNLMLEIAQGAVDPASKRAAELGVSARLPDGFDAWFSRCMQIAPERRFCDGAEATRELEVLLTRATSAPPPTPSPVPSPAPVANVQETRPVSAPPMPPGGFTAPVVGPLPTPKPVVPPPPTPIIPMTPAPSSSSGSGVSRVGLAGAGAVALAVVVAFAWPKTKPDEHPAPDASPVVVPRDAAVPPPSPSPPTRVTEGCVRLAGGTFTMGSPAGEGLSFEHPQHRVTLPGFCIDRTEVTVAAYRACVQASNGCEAPTAYSATPGQFQVFCNWGRSDRDDHPINCVTPAQAERFCAWRHTNGHLPTEDQWEFAARGTSGRKYPWGDTPEPSPQNTNLCGSECRDFAASVGYAGWTVIANWTDPWPTTSAVGALPQAGDTPDGLIGMAGNVWEWTRTPYGAYTSRAGSATTYTSVDRNNRVYRGGGWDVSVPGVARAAYRDRNDSTNGNAEVGFRCVAEE